ncbi:Lipoprotein LipO precursor [Paenibacillus konkukensis]|uniref:Lipoprotein LipO n=1 Tax=Paenibacillus konkukensis TaxID=2020716 RepID=A0ABY4RY79_9BACL|nr:hypothetical protein [Paenibacillus konkukensis]UQZ86377.1 Lipoprotein LipO precursor [Paenibacillus konkukensis]
MRNIRKSLLAVMISTALMLSACTNSQPPSKTEEKPVISWAGGPNYPFKDDTYGQKYMEDTFGIKIKPVRVDNQEKLNLLVSTGEIPDLIALDKTELSNYVKNDLLAQIPLEMIQKYAPNYYNIMLKQDGKVFVNNKVNGKNYALPILEANTAPYPVAIRGDWLQNVGADIPITLQELENVFIKFRNDDPDRNGKKDTYALSTASDNPNLWFNSIFGAFGTNPFMWHLQNGQLVYGFTMNETKDALKVLKKWKDMDLIDPEFITDKRRTSGKDDVPYKFASGRIGYLDTLAYADYQWDNDGHLNAKWVSLHPEWKTFFDTSDNPYSTAPFTKLTTSGPQPVYVNVKPPVGPQGKSGTFVTNSLSKYVVFGKQVESDEGKMIKLLQIVNTLISDENVMIAIEVGKEGEQWIWNENHQRVPNPEFQKSELYHPQGRNIGTGLFFDVTYSSNPDMLAIFGGPRAIQRYETTKKKITDFPGIINELKAPLPSEAKYSDLKSSVQEYILKAILGEVDIDATYADQVQKWKNSGGEVLTKEANEWYASVK